MGVVGSISIKDKASSVLKNVQTKQAALRKDAAEIRKELKRTWDKKYTAVVKLKDAASTKISQVTGKLKTIGGKIFSPVVSLKDAATKGLSAIGNKIKSMAKTLVIPVTAAVTISAAALGNAVSSGMELENQQVSIKHFIGATNKGMSDEEVNAAANQFTEDLRANANATPFETGEVISAGARAISIVNGDTDQAMEIIRLAEDMAAASGGTKSLADAIEALADAKMGEMERLKEFGFKISAEEFDEKGFEGVAADLGDFFGGAAEKLAQTGSGLMSTIKGKLKSSIADIGLSIVEKLKPALNKAISLIDKVQPYFKKFGSGIADGVGKGIDIAIAVLPSLMSGLKSLSPVISSLSTAVSVLAPVFSNIFSDIGEKVGGVISFIGERMGFIQKIISSAGPLIADIVSTAWGVISPVLDIAISACEGLFGVVQKVFPGIQAIIETVWGVVKPLVEGIGSAIKEIAGWFGSAIDTFTGETSFTSSGERAKGAGAVIGNNAEGDNNWKGGLTWVGEKGPELVDLPKGSRILPNKESISVATSGGVLSNTTKVIQNPVMANNGQNLSPVIMLLGSIDNSLKSLAGRSGRMDSMEVPKNEKSGSYAKRFIGNVTVRIAKLADEIIVREDKDIDEIADAVSKKIVEVIVNMG